MQESELFSRSPYEGLDEEVAAYFGIDPALVESLALLEITDTGISRVTLSDTCKGCTSEELCRR